MPETSSLTTGLLSYSASLTITHSFQSDSKAMAMFDPKSEQKLEGHQFVGNSGMDMSQLSDADLVEIMRMHGERLPGSPQPAPSGSDRPNLNLYNAPSLQFSVPRAEEDLLALARQCYASSETYFNAAHRTRLMDAMARFNSEHPKGSKYWSPSFDKRSKLFRPKTRSYVRSREAAAVIAMFGSADIVSVNSPEPTMEGAQDARMQEAVLNYRLQEDDRFYRFYVGALQDAERQGFAVAKTYWDYDEGNRYYDENHPILGQMKRVDTIATVDRPGWDLVPLENFYFSPGTNWMNVIEKSPYLIEKIPMFLCDIRKYADNPRAKLKYKNLPDATLLSGGHNTEWDAIRMQRERNRLNRYERNGEPSDYAICYVHRNIVKIEGIDYVFDTIGNVAVLSNVIPLSEFDPRGYRPYVVGSTMFESHNPWNYGSVSLMGNLQDEINDTANLRLDGTKMATSGRMFIKRGSGIDLTALARFAPGAVTEMENPAQDVKWDRGTEPPRSAFEENQLMSSEMDDLIGGFNQSSVSNNRNLNETVGGMQITQTGAAQLTEYDLHTFTKTFIGKVLTQTLDNIKYWETDGSIASIIGQKMGATAKQFWKSLDRKTKIIVNIGFGATNPQKRIERIGMAFGMAGKMFPQRLASADQDEVIKEIFAAAGFTDAQRFFPDMDKNMQNDPVVKALQRQVQDLQSQLNPYMQKLQITQQIQQLKNQGSKELQQLISQNAENIKNMELSMAYVDLQLRHEQNDIQRGSLMLKRDQLSHQIQMDKDELMLAMATAMQSPNPPQIPIANEGAPPTQNPTPQSAATIPTFAQDVESSRAYANAQGNP